MLECFKKQILELESVAPKGCRYGKMLIILFTFSFCSVSDISFCILSQLITSGGHVEWYRNCSVQIFGASFTCAWTLVLQEIIINGNSIHQRRILQLSYLKIFSQFYFQEVIYLLLTSLICWLFFLADMLLFLQEFHVRFYAFLIRGIHFVLWNPCI